MLYVAVLPSWAILACVRVGSVKRARSYQFLTYTNGGGGGKFGEKQKKKKKEVENEGKEGKEEEEERKGKERRKKKEEEKEKKEEEKKKKGASKTKWDTVLLLPCEQVGTVQLLQERRRWRVSSWYSLGGHSEHVRSAVLEPATYRSPFRIAL